MFNDWRSPRPSLIPTTAMNVAAKHEIPIASYPMLQDRVPNRAVHRQLINSANGQTGRKPQLRRNVL